MCRRAGLPHARRRAHAFRWREGPLRNRWSGAGPLVERRCVLPSPGWAERLDQFGQDIREGQADKYGHCRTVRERENVRAHCVYETTGPEIWRQTEGRLTHLFSRWDLRDRDGCSRFLEGAEPRRAGHLPVQPSEGHVCPRPPERQPAGRVGNVVRPVHHRTRSSKWTTNWRYGPALDLARTEGPLGKPPSSRAHLRGGPPGDRARSRGVGVVIFFQTMSSVRLQHGQALPAAHRGTQPR